MRSFDGRLAGQTWETPFIPVPSGRIGGDQISTIDNFHQAYAQRTGNRFDGLPVQGVTFRVEAVIPTSKVEYPGSRPAARARPPRAATPRSTTFTTSR